jgi:hypothetical protein
LKRSRTRALTPTRTRTPTRTLAPTRTLNRTLSPALTRALTLAPKRALLLALIACGSNTTPPASAPKDVAVAKVDGGGELETTPSPDAGPTKPSEPPIESGWITVDYKTGRSEYVEREKVLTALKEGNTRVLARISKIIEECSSVGGSHVFFEPAFSKESPFATAHFGGHGAHLVHAKGSIFGDEKQLFVISVETHSPSSFGNGRGWCLENAPRYDADVLAIIPVRSEGEGMRLLTDLSK